jgi:hypothetical protein
MANSDDRAREHIGCTSSLDLSGPFSTFFELLRPSSTFEFVRFAQFRFFRHSRAYTGFPDLLRPSIRSESIDFFFHLLRSCAHFSDLTRVYSNWFYLLQPFTTFDFARFGSSATLDGSVSTQGWSNSLRCAPECSVSAKVGAEGQKGRRREGKGSGHWGPADRWVKKKWK